MSDLSMSHPIESFNLVKHPFLTGMYTNPHYPFTSTSSGKRLTNSTFDPRYMNETTNKLGSCTVLDHVASFEDYQLTKDNEVSTSNDTEDATFKIEPWYLSPKHTMKLIPRECHEKAFSICDHKSPLAFKSYRMTPTQLFDSRRMSTAVGFYTHPMNSITACVASCISKNGTATIIVLGKTCLCSHGKI